MKSRFTRADLERVRDQLKALDVRKMQFKRVPAFVRAVEELEAFVTSYGPLALFEPNKPQRQFLECPGKPKLARVRLFLGGNRSGKTECLVAESISFALGERLWDGTKLPIRVPNRGRIHATSYLDGIKKVIEPKLDRLLPKDLIASTKRGQQGGLIEVRLKNGSWFDLVSGEQESMKQEGADMDWFACDEPLPRENWIANWRGLTDRGGYAMFALTPLTEPWIKEELFDRAMTDDDFFAVVADTYDNVGYGLTEAAVKKFESSLNEDERATRIRGQFLVLQGMVYKEYKDAYYPDGHLVKPFSIPENWPRFIGIDPHDRTPTHILWMAVDEHEDVFIYDEAAIGGKTIKEISEEIKEREAKHDEPGFREIRIIDPASAAKKNSVEVGLSIQEMFMQNGIYCYPANNDIEAGHKAVREYLRFRQTIRGNRPRLFIFDTCRGFRRAIMNYVYDDRSYKGTNKDYRDPKENRVREKDKHWPDTLRYVLMFNPRYWHNRDAKKERNDRWMHG